MPLFPRRVRRDAERVNPADVERSAAEVADRVAHAADDLEAAFRQLRPVLDRLPSVVDQQQRPAPPTRGRRG